MLVLIWRWSLVWRWSLITSLAIAGFWWVSYLDTGYMAQAKLTACWLVPNLHHDWLVPRIWDWLLGPMFSVIFVAMFTGEKMKGVDGHIPADKVILMIITFILGIIAGANGVNQLGPSNAVTFGFLAGLLAGIIGGWLFMGMAISFAFGIGLSAGIFAELGCGVGLLIGFFLWAIGWILNSKETYRNIGRWLIAKDKKDQIQ